MKNLSVNNFLDIALLAVLLFLMGNLGYTPFFFGDELKPLGYGVAHENNFFKIFHEMNIYKPRFLYNSLISFLASIEASRRVYEIVFISIYGYLILIIYLFSINILESKRISAVLLVATIITSRYGIMLYFDYISGIIEILACSIMLTCLFVLIGAFKNGFSNYKIAVIFCLSILCIFVHERYFLAIAFSLLTVCIINFKYIENNQKIIYLFKFILLITIPVALFYLSIKLVGALPIETGSGGMNISLDTGNVLSFLTYFYNIFFGGNYGHAWLWGELNYLHSGGKYLGYIATFINLILVFIFIRKRKFIKEKASLKLSFILFSSIVGLIFVASLVGLERQEARFMYPVGILFGLLILNSVDKLLNYLPLLVILGFNIIYIITGSYNLIANVYASRAANTVARSLLAINYKNGNGVILGNNDDRWSFGSSNFEHFAFSKYNLMSKYSLVPYVDSIKNFDNFNFALIFSGFNADRSPTYKYSSVNNALVTLGKKSIDDVPIYINLGVDNKWNGWNFSPEIKVAGDGVIVSGDLNGWVEVPASSLNGNWLVYKVDNLGLSKAKIRSQVNWHKKINNEYIDTSIKVFDISDKNATNITLLSAPPGAEIGYVYISLHDGNKNNLVKVRSVDIKKTNY